MTTATSTLSCTNATEGNIELRVSADGTCLDGYSYVWDTDETLQDIGNIGPENNVVTVTDGSGCTNAHTVTVSAYILNPTISQLGNTLTSVQTWVTYQWLLGGSSISGANNNSYTATSTGSYSLSVTDTNCCTAVTDTVYITIVGISGHLGEWSDLALYPNPTNSDVWLRTASPITNGLTVTIKDMFGRQILKNELSQLDHALKLDLHAVSTGSYFMEVISEAGKRRLFRVVVE